VTLREINPDTSLAKAKKFYALDYLCYPTSALATWIDWSCGRRFHSPPVGCCRDRIGYPAGPRASALTGTVGTLGNRYLNRQRAAGNRFKNESLI
jgi:hypothetical protein